MFTKEHHLNFLIFIYLCKIFIFKRIHVLLKVFIAVGWFLHLPLISTIDYCFCFPSLNVFKRHLFKFIYFPHFFRGFHEIDVYHCRSH